MEGTQAVPPLEHQNHQRALPGTTDFRVSFKLFSCEVTSTENPLGFPSHGSQKSGQISPPPIPSAKVFVQSLHWPPESGKCMAKSGTEYWRVDSLKLTKLCGG